MDFTPFFIESKTTRNFFSSLNLSYTFPGKPQGFVGNNLFNYAIGTIYEVSPKSILLRSFMEILLPLAVLNCLKFPGNPQTNIDISGGETVGWAGNGYCLNRNILISFGISYDNNHALLFIPGIVWTSQNGKRLFGR